MVWEVHPSSPSCKWGPGFFCGANSLALCNYKAGSLMSDQIQLCLASLTISLIHKRINFLNLLGQNGRPMLKLYGQRGKMVGKWPVTSSNIAPFFIPALIQVGLWVPTPLSGKYDLSSCEFLAPLQEFASIDSQCLLNAQAAWLCQVSLTLSSNPSRWLEFDVIRIVSGEVDLTTSSKGGR